MSTGLSGLDSWRDQILEDKKRRRKEEKRQSDAREQSVWNIRLLAFTVLGAIWWYYWHLEPLMREAMIVGTPLSIFAALKLLQSWLPREHRWSSDPHATSTRILSQPYARIWLCVAAGVVAILWLTTSSIYIEYDKGTGSGDYEVAIYDGNDLVMEPRKVSSYSPVYGKPFFFDWTSLFRPKEIRLEVTKPLYRYDTKDVTIGSPRTCRVKIPADFETKKHRIFRLLPQGDQWMSLNVRKDDPTDSGFLLVVQLNNGTQNESNPQTLLEVPYFFEPVYFGGPAEMIAFFLNAEKNSDKHRWNVVGHLKKIYGVNNKEDYENKANLLIANETVCETIEIEENWTLIIRVLKPGPEGEPPVEIMEHSHLVKSEGGIHNIYLPNPGSQP